MDPFLHYQSVTQNGVFILLYTIWGGVCILLLWSKISKVIAGLPSCWGNWISWLFRMLFLESELWAPGKIVWAFKKSSGLIKSLMLWNLFWRTREYLWQWRKRLMARIAIVPINHWREEFTLRIPHVLAERKSDPVTVTLVSPWAESI